MTSRGAKKPKAGRPQKSEQLQMNQIRMSSVLTDRIRSYEARLLKETGIDVGFAAAVRSLVEKGLKEVGL